MIPGCPFSSGRRENDQSKVVVRDMGVPVLFWRTLFLILCISFTISSCILRPALVHLDQPRPPSPDFEVIYINSVTTEDKGDVVRITIQASRPFSYNIFNHSAPMGLLLAIPQAELHQDLSRELIVEKGPVKTIHLRPSEETGDGTEIVIRLDQETDYQVQKKGEVLFVDVKNPTHVASPVSSLPAEPDPPEEKDEPPLPDPQDYLIGGGDVLQITVYDEPDLSKTVRVSTGGVISFPLIGKVSVSDLTAAQVEWELQELLKKGYLLNPQVAVLVTEYHSQEVFILGAVERPGAYPLTKRSNILEMLSRAGGIATKNESAQAGRELVLLRPVFHSQEDGEEVIEEVQHIRIDLKRLLSQGDASLNLFVQDKDTLYIPLADSVFVFGEVKSPGSYKILEKDITLLEAITMAGGFTQIASPNQTKVVRIENGVERTIVVNVDDITKRGDKGKDIRLKAGDLVVVPESFF